MSSFVVFETEMMGKDLKSGEQDGQTGPVQRDETTQLERLDAVTTWAHNDEDNASSPSTDEETHFNRLHKDKRLLGANVKKAPPLYEVGSSDGGNLVDRRSSWTPKAPAIQRVRSCSPLLEQLPVLVTAAPSFHDDTNDDRRHDESSDNASSSPPPPPLPPRQNILFCTTSARRVDDTAPEAILAVVAPVIVRSSGNENADGNDATRNNNFGERRKDIEHDNEIAVATPVPLVEAKQQYWRRKKWFVFVLVLSVAAVLAAIIVGVVVGLSHKPAATANATRSRSYSPNVLPTITPAFEAPAVTTHATTTSLPTPSVSGDTSSLRPQVVVLPPASAPIYHSPAPTGTLKPTYLSPKGKSQGPPVTSRSPKRSIAPAVSGGVTSSTPSYTVVPGTLFPTSAATRDGTTSLPPAEVVVKPPPAPPGSLVSTLSPAINPSPPPTVTFAPITVVVPATPAPVESPLPPNSPSITPKVSSVDSTLRPTTVSAPAPPRPSTGTRYPKNTSSPTA